VDVKSSASPETATPASRSGRFGGVVVVVALVLLVGGVVAVAATGGGDAEDCEDANPAARLGDGSVRASGPAGIHLIAQVRDADRVVLAFPTQEGESDPCFEEATRSESTAFGGDSDDDEPADEEVESEFVPPRSMTVTRADELCYTQDYVRAAAALFVETYPGLDPGTGLTATNIRAGWDFGGQTRANYGVYVDNGWLPPLVEADVEALHLAFVELERAGQSMDTLVRRIESGDCFAGDEQPRRGRDRTPGVPGE
jgi:hypothetical protein